MDEFTKFLYLRGVVLIILGLFMIISTLYAGQRRIFNENCPCITKYDNPKIGYEAPSYLFICTGAVFLLIGLVLIVFGV